MKLITQLSLAILFSASSLVYADNTPSPMPSATEIEAQLKQHYPATTFKKVTQTPVPGIYQVTMGNNVIYVGTDVRYFILGRMVDVKTQQDLAGETEEFTQISINSIPMENAIKRVNGNGKHKLIVFADPLCSFCKKLEHELSKLENITFYTLPYPVLGAESKRVASSVICSDNPAKNWALAMSDSYLESTETCDDGLSKMLEFGQSNMINGTPFLVREDGQTHAGMMSAAELQAWLENVQ